MLTEKEIENALAVLREVKSESSKNDRYGFEDEWNVFLKKMQFLSPKAFGTRIQNRIIEKNNFNKVKASRDKGDFEYDGKYYEFKVSILNASNKAANFVNIRPYQDIEGYYLIVVNTNTSPYQTSQYYLSKAQMDKELEHLHAGAANGTKESNKANKNISYRFSIDLMGDNDNSRRWAKEYRTNNLKL